jgi:hypothetical protein
MNTVFIEMGNLNSMVNRMLFWSEISIGLGNGSAFSLLNPSGHEGLGSN